MTPIEDRDLEVSSNMDIAIIGMSARFPGASNYNEFWENLLEGKESISTFAATHPESSYVSAKPWVEEADCFDAPFFKIAPKEAILLDPQQRLLLECAWHAFEDAGYLPNEIEGQVGVFATSHFNTYQHVEGWFSRYWKAQEEKPSSRFLAYTGNIQDALSMRISYKLNLKGPSMTVLTACSSSLVALHLGCQSLLLGESDVVLVGAAALTFPDREGYYYEPGMIYSSDGHCRAFDEKANGVIFGDGVGCVVLKPLEKALRDRDHIYAIIKGSAVNNDGKRKVDFNAPSVAGQAEVIRQAHAVAGIDPETISYVEAHGTGTLVGDPIEFEALRQAFGMNGKKKKFCGLGSVKTNLGHLDAASGIAGFMKAVLSLDRQLIPPTLHFSQPNPQISLEDSPFYIVTKKKVFKRGKQVRRSAVTSLGIGGTNAHLVLQEAPLLEKMRSQFEGGFFVLSAETKEQLDAYLEALLAHLKKYRKTLRLEDLLFTLGLSRIQKRVRCVGFFQTLGELEKALERKDMPFFEAGETVAIPDWLSEEAKECLLAWMDGKKVAHHSYFLSMNAKRIPLPGYPFERKRYWYDQLEGTSLEKDFLSWFAHATGNKAEEISLNDPLEKFSIDSVLAASLTKEINDLFGPVPSTFLFEHYCLGDLLQVLQKNPSKKEAIPLTRSEMRLAIVGMSCHLPSSKTAQELWDHLLQGRNLITKIPKERWDHSLYYDERVGVEGKTYSEYGGFLDTIDGFDPLFFKMSPREAALLDPQERLFLQSAWEALEDAGYSPKELNRKTEHLVGVYVGASYQEYQLYGIEERAKNHPVILNGVMGTIANRVSFFCDFRGPSLTVDTMCSASLTALSLACQDLETGKIRAALVGGVNLIPHSNRYLQLAQERFLSPEGICRSFGQGGSGYIPAEGIVSILIKPLEAALQEGDHIYGIIRGIATNHGGKTNGFTVPNARAQAEVIRTAIQQSGIHPEQISYVEAHGTGTALGDPIEIRGLTEGFQTQKKQFCAIGSIKSNMGHAESAAGLAGLLKILLQFQHRQLVPSIHAESLNASIPFDTTPFYVQRERSVWEASFPRFAALSSFGAGGSNVHAILEEYEAPICASSDSSPFPLVLSAMTKEQLESCVQTLYDFLKERRQLRLEDIAFTLAVGREAFSIREGWICHSIDELLEKWEAFLLGQKKKEKGPQKLQALLNSWLKGEMVDWNPSFEGKGGRRVSLPTYPFALVPCRFESASTVPSSSLLHPLVHENISDLTEVRFHSQLSSTIESIRDHRIGEEVIYPGAAYLEMTLFLAGQVLKRGAPFSMTQIKWLKALSLSASPCSIFTSLIPEEKQTGIEIWREEKVYFQAFLSSVEVFPSKDVWNKRSIEPTSVYSKEECYAKYREQNFRYGELYQTIQSIQVEGNEAFIEAELGAVGVESFILHPALLDAAFQSTIAFDWQRDTAWTYVPTGIEKFHFYNPVSGKIYIHARQLEGKKQLERQYDLKIYNEQKELCIEIEKFTESPLLSGTTSSSVVYAVPTWREKKREAFQKAERHLLYVSHLFSTSEPNPLNIQEETLIPHLLSLVETLQGQKSCSITMVFREEEEGLARPFVGLFRALAIEQPSLLGRVILMPHYSQEWVEKEKEGIDPFVRYDAAGNRRVEVYEEIPQVPHREAISWVRPKGVYLILGGSGGIGRQLVAFFRSKAIPCQLILAGRKQVEDDFEKDSQCSVRCVCCDVTDARAVEQLIESTKPSGVIYLAGVTRDRFFMHKNREEFEGVLAPKIQGLLHLKKALKNHPLDYLVLFSSDSSIFGTAGQTDYCAANSFLDGFTALPGVKQLKVFNWPYWKEGGMRLSEEVLDRLFEEEGVVPLETGVAFEALDKLLSLPDPRVLILQGQRQKILRRLNLEKGETRSRESVQLDVEGKKKVADFLRKTLSHELKIDPHLLQEKTPFENFGIDSILSMNLISTLEKNFSSLPKTLFFEHMTFGSLVRYFIEHHASYFVSPSQEKSFSPVRKDPVLEKPTISLRNREKEEKKPYSSDIAIIGIAGRYPQADDLEELWENLVQGKNCIEEIPSDRFEYRTIFEENTRTIGKTKSKWGGFLRDVYAFDPLFFKISKDEAERLDPQEKLFLQACWHAMEDAGYTREKLVSLAKRKVGVYAGSMYQEYQIFNGEQGLLGNPVMLSGSASSIANRVSYFLNLTGPSLTLDTMCSSALTALSLACQDLKLGKCKMAFAGGVNVAVHPNKYQVLTYENFLSSDGLCKSFGAGGDGYVPSEGVGAVLLKPLEDAIRDGDPIYAIIKGIDINHGGQASGYTVPNAAAQAEVVSLALQQAGLKKEAISYIEAHGTGTALGDPIEISGLSQAFGQIERKIPIGSIKSNMGHCESAAGIAALTKVLLQMQHNQLVPSLHSTPPNPYIAFDQLPFTVQKTSSPWKEERKIALISSFGAGGSNACVIVEKSQREETPPLESKLSRLFVLSAKDSDRLRDYAKKFLFFLEKQEGKGLSLASFAYTLQTGREVFPEKLAIVFEDLKDLRQKLTLYLENQKNLQIFLAQKISFNELLEVIGIQEDFQQFLREKGPIYPIEVLGKLWVHGAQIDWQALYRDKRPALLHLPLYPFAKIPCFFKKVDSVLPSSEEKRLHPLLHQNISTFSQFRFRSSLSDRDPILRDHVVQKEWILPGAAVVEMFFSGASLLSGQECQLENLVWLKGVRKIRPSLQVDTVFEGQGETAMLIDENQEICSQCRVVFSSSTPTLEFFQLESLQKELKHRIYADQIYSDFLKMGFSFGPTFRTLEQIAFSQDAFLAKIKLSSETSSYRECHISPYCLDAALQATIVFSQSDLPTLPFSIRKISRSASKNEIVWIYGKRVQNAMCDLFLLDQRGNAVVSIYGFQDAPITKRTAEPSKNSLDILLELVKEEALNLEEAEEALMLLSP